MAMHNPPIPANPRAVRVFLVYRTSRTMIIRVRRMLRAIEIERYGIPKLTLYQKLPPDWEVW